MHPFSLSGFRVLDHHRFQRLLVVQCKLFLFCDIKLFSRSVREFLMIISEEDARDETHETPIVHRQMWSRKRQHVRSLDKLPSCLCIALELCVCWWLQTNPIHLAGQFLCRLQASSERLAQVIRHAKTFNLGYRAGRSRTFCWTHPGAFPLLSPVDLYQCISTLFKPLAKAGLDLQDLSSLLTALLDFFHVSSFHWPLGL